VERNKIKTILTRVRINVSHYFKIKERKQERRKKEINVPVTTSKSKVGGFCNLCSLPLERKAA
jgi:hypothetical protein